VSLAPARTVELVQLRKKRNRAEHFHLADTVAAISAITARTLGFALDFIAGEFDAGALSPTASHQLEEIRAALPRLEHFVAHRHASIVGQVAVAQTAIVKCPSCGQETSVLDDGVTCLFCRATAVAEDGADNYAHVVLGESFYKSGKQGIDWVVSSCPECQAETLVDRGLSGNAEPADQWVCFTCGTAWPEGSLGKCDRCGELIAAGEDEMSICGDCLSALVAKE
jgi:Zn finger protein HypA/HybF involved in hydrogenase expression